MFRDPNIQNRKRGWIEVVCGSMFSGKTEELIRRLKRAQIAKYRVEIFKPAIDVRYDVADIVSHNENRIRSTPVQNANEILMYTNDVDVIGIDETQFFDEEIVSVAAILANKGTRVIAAGLDMDFSGKPFGPIPKLLAMAEDITKLHAICVQCGDNALFSYRKVASEQTILLGEKSEYEPRCRACFNEI